MLPLEVYEQAVNDKTFLVAEYKENIVGILFIVFRHIESPNQMTTYLVYQIAQAAISFEGDLSEKMEMRMVHNYAEGCMFDLCMNKKDIHLGMIAGNICPKCRANLVRYGISEKAI